MGVIASVHVYDEGREWIFAILKRTYHLNNPESLLLSCCDANGKDFTSLYFGCNAQAQ